MNENIDNIINKLVRYKIKESDLNEIAPFIGTKDFSDHFETIEAINSIFQEEGRLQAKKELNDIIKQEKRTEKYSKIINLKEYRLHAVAACVLFTCSAGIIKQTTGYNKESNFRKTYIIQNERK